MTFSIGAHEVMTVYILVKLADFIDVGIMSVYSSVAWLCMGYTILMRLQINCICCLGRFQLIGTKLYGEINW